MSQENTKKWLQHEIDICHQRLELIASLDKQGKEDLEGVRNDSDTFFRSRLFAFQQVLARVEHETLLKSLGAKD